MSNVKIGDTIKGQVTGITKYGVFVSLNDAYSGMVHISEVSDKFVSDLDKKFNIGDIISVKVLDIDEDKMQVKLSIKELDFKIETGASAIKEKGTGFNIIAQNFESWVNEKMEEINTK
ncbi:MAG: S1 RNA-binding domain-containing protein [Bacilli bacterium]|nr:S1 RNA-binding domain-containing protein [Bacilli bacterium]